MADDLDMTEDDGDDMPTAPFWMTTFSDMVTLLLTFFVLIVSMSEVQVQKFKEAMSHFQGRTSVLQNEAVILPAQMQETIDQLTKEQIERYEAVVEYLREKGMAEKVQLDLREDGLHVTLTDSILFESGQATLIEPAREVLRPISQILGDGVQSVVVEGHTDDRPIQTHVYPSNWELSTARATSVIRFFLSEENALSPAAYVPVGYAEHHPVDTNETAEGRARNRRVEILFSWKPWQNGQMPLREMIPMP